MKTILIVDDEEMIVMMTENILSGSYHTLRALSGEEAIVKYGMYKPDLILADIMMPEMSGIEMLKAMKEKFGGHIPIVFMTASEDDEIELNSILSGAVDFIRKPLKADVLMSKVNNIISQLEQARQG